MPRTLVFDFREEYPDSLTQEEISQLISDGETIGIYWGVFLMNGDQQRVTDLVEGLASKDGVYFLLALRKLSVLVLPKW